MKKFEARPLIQIIIEVSTFLEREFRLWLREEKIDPYDLKTEGFFTLGYFKVDDAEKAVEWLKAHGVEPR